LVRLYHYKISALSKVSRQVSRQVNKPKRKPDRP
jgi:hypothetical protein